MGLRVLQKGPTAVRILSGLHRGLNHQPTGSQSCTSATRLQAAKLLAFQSKLNHQLRVQIQFMMNTTHHYRLLANANNLIYKRLHFILFIIAFVYAAGYTVKRFWLIASLKDNSNLGFEPATFRFQQPPVAYWLRYMTG